MSDVTSERLTALEEKLMHLESQVTTLDELVLELNRENAGLRSEVRALRQGQQRISQALKDGETEAPRDLEEERPPHW